MYRQQAWPGTTVCIYLPRVDGGVAVALCDAFSTLPTGSETILIAEDEASVCTTIARSLRELGYTVLETNNGADALAIAQAYHGVIDLLLSDMAMPCMGGLALAERLGTLRPGIAVSSCPGT